MFPAQENQPDITANFFTWKATPNPLSLTHRPPTNSSDPPPPPRTPPALRLQTTSSFPSKNQDAIAPKTTIRSKTKSASQTNRRKKLTLPASITYPQRSIAETYPY